MRIRWRLMEPKAATILPLHQSVRFAPKTIELTFACAPFARATSVYLTEFPVQVITRALSQDEMKERESELALPSAT